MSCFYRYRCYGLTLLSEFYLPELDHHDAGLHLPMAEELSSDHFGSNGFNQDRDQSLPSEVIIKQGEVDVSFLRSKNAWFAKKSLDTVALQIKDVANFEIIGGHTVIIDCLCRDKVEVMRLFLLGTVLGCILHQRHLIPLHVGAVEINGKALAFTAPSGTGKSTLVSRLYRFANCSLICDDVATLDLNTSPPLMYGGPPFLKLGENWVHAFDQAEIESIPHPESTKSRVFLREAFIAQPLPLSGLVLLERCDGIKEGQLDIEPLSGSEAFAAAREAIYRYQMGLAMSSPEHMFNQLTQLTQNVRFYRGKLGPWDPSDEARLGQTEHTIVERLADLTQSS